MSITISLCLLFNFIGIIGVIKESTLICYVCGIILSIGTVRQLFVSLQDKRKKVTIPVQLVVIILDIYLYLFDKKEKKET